MTDFDFLVVGSGIAGASAAAQLAGRARVCVIERESAHGYHTTGRSAALWTALYGNAPVRALTVASRGFYDAPPEGFAAQPLLRPRGCLYFATDAQLGDLEEIADGADALGIETHHVSAADARARCPVLRPEVLAGALHEPDAMDIDVDALHQGFLRMARAAGAVIRLDAGLEGLEREGGAWVARLPGGERIRAGAVIDAAGAWADEVAIMAGVSPVGLTPLKRTAFILEEPPGVDSRDWPAMIEAVEAFYFKPESGRLLVSACDETPSPPCDAWPDDLTVAECVERMQERADIPVRRILRAWAGLRTFAPDRSLVIGYQPDAEGFFWLAGQGGYGVQTAPAAGRAAAALALGEDLPADMTALGLTAEQLGPGRFAA